MAIISRWRMSDDDGDCGDDKHDAEDDEDDDKSLAAAGRCKVRESCLAFGQKIFDV